MSTEAGAFTPNNSLEASLMKACLEPETRAEFLEELVDSTIFIVPRDPDFDATSEIELVSVTADDQTFIPFFTSEERIEALLPGPQPSMPVTARSFFEKTRGTPLVLNPGSDFGKEFFPDEVEALLKGDFFDPGLDHVEPDSMQVMMGQPQVAPQALLDALSKLYANHPVERAYMALYMTEESSEPPRLLIALETDATDWQKIVSESGVAAQGLTEPFNGIDFIRLQDSGFEEYFAEEPEALFYTKSPSA